MASENVIKMIETIKKDPELMKDFSKAILETFDNLVINPTIPEKVEFLK